MKKALSIIVLFFIFFWVSFASWDIDSTISISERIKFFLILIPAALWDSINPCAFAVMFILLSSILKTQKSKSKVLLAWFLFILAVFISYMAMWIWLYSALATTNSIFYLKLVVWILWVVIWLANLKDYFWYWKYFKMEVPDSWRPKMKSFLKKVVSPLWAFVVWFLISLFLLPCTSWPYLMVLWYLASESSALNLWWYVYITIYNIIFIIPMIIISILVAFWFKNVSELKEYKAINVERMHLITWVIMLLIWLYILFDILI